MKDQLFLSFLLCGLYAVICLHLPDRVHFFVNVEMNWTEAQQFCREHYTDLATINSSEEVHLLPRPASNTANIWIGLNADPSNQYWAQSYPRPGECTGMRGGDGKWKTNTCTLRIHFICEDALGFYYYAYSRAWSVAVGHCQMENRELATIQSAEDHQAVLALLQPYGNRLTDPTALMVWIQNPAWDWSEHVPVSFTNWLSGHPLSLAYASCAVVDPNNYWTDVNCGLKHAAFCYQNAKTSTLVKVSMRSTLNILDPENYKLITQKIEEQLQQNGLEGVTVKAKGPPKKTT